MRGDGSGKDRLTSGSVVNVAPSLSPAGARLVFVRRLAGDRDDLFRIDADGSGLRRLTRTAVAETDPTWSPDGGLIACSAGRAPGSFEIVVLEPDGTGRRRLTRNGVDDLDPDWAPAGGRLAFTRLVGGANAEIYVVGEGGKRAPAPDRPRGRRTTARTGRPPAGSPTSGGSPAGARSGR